jgi:putative oxidoreductase
MHSLYQLLQHGAGAVDVALFVNRVLIGMFFVLSGYHKLFNAERHKSLVASLVECKIPCLPVMQWFVPGVEFFGGLAVVIGLLAPLAALGLVVICLVAFWRDGIKRIVAWKPIDKADYCDDVLYLPEVLYVIALAVVILAGPGCVFAACDYL